MMTENEKRCAFAKENKGKYYCNILKVDECKGFDIDCKFRKTKAQLTDEEDRHIDRHRRLGRCKGCRYCVKPCKKSDEK